MPCSTDPSHERVLRHSFLATFRTIAHGERIFDALLVQYNEAQPNGLTGSEADEWRLRHLFPMQRRVLEVFRTWLVDHRMVEDDPLVARRLQAFLIGVPAGDKNASLAAEVMKLLEQMVCDTSPV